MDINTQVHDLIFKLITCCIIMIMVFCLVDVGSSRLTKGLSELSCIQ